MDPARPLLSQVYLVHQCQHHLIIVIILAFISMACYSYPFTIVSTNLHIHHNMCGYGHLQWKYLCYTLKVFVLWNFDRISFFLRSGITPILGRNVSRSALFVFVFVLSVYLYLCLYLYLCHAHIGNFFFCRSGITSILGKNVFPNRTRTLTASICNRP